MKCADRLPCMIHVHAHGICRSQSSHRIFNIKSPRYRHSDLPEVFITATKLKYCIALLVFLIMDRVPVTVRRPAEGLRPARYFFQQLLDMPVISVCNDPSVFLYLTHELSESCLNLFQICIAVKMITVNIQYDCSLWIKMKKCFFIFTGFRHKDVTAADTHTSANGRQFPSDMNRRIFSIFDQYLCQHRYSCRFPVRSAYCQCVFILIENLPEQFRTVQNRNIPSPAFHQFYMILRDCRRINNQCGSFYVFQPVSDGYRYALFTKL